jgi:hypothetical protein
MKTVYSAPNISLVSIFQNILAGYGIRCRLKNEFLSIVDETLSEKDLPSWNCDSCREVIEGQFTECWKCGKSRPI